MKKFRAKKRLPKQDRLRYHVYELETGKIQTERALESVIRLNVVFVVSEMKEKLGPVFTTVITLSTLERLKHKKR